MGGLNNFGDTKDCNRSEKILDPLGKPSNDQKRALIGSQRFLQESGVTELQIGS